MTDILKTIYESEDLFNKPFSEEYQKLCQEDAALWDKVTPLLGMDMIDKLSDSRAAVAAVGQDKLLHMLRPRGQYFGIAFPDERQPLGIFLADDDPPRLL